MAYKFTATHGVHFTDQVKDDKTGDLLHDEWAAFKLDETAGEKPSQTGQRGGLGSRVYRFETDDAKVAERLRKIDDYGISEDKTAAAKSDEKKS